MKNKASISALLFSTEFFLMLGIMRYLPDVFVRLDLFTTSLVTPFQHLNSASLFIVITTFGGIVGIILIGLIVALFLRSRPHLIMRMVVGLSATSLSVSLVKSLIERVRPPALPWLGQLHSYSFPSGHSASGMMLYGFIFVVIFLYMKNSLTKRLLLFVLPLLILAIGVSRIVLAAHYGSDVLAGFLLGGLWLSLVFVPDFSPQERKGMHRVH